MTHAISTLVASLGLAAVLISGALTAQAEVCTTQSQMKDADRQSLVAAAETLTKAVEANDIAGLRARTNQDLAKDFGAVTLPALRQNLVEVLSSSIRPTSWMRPA